MMRLRDLLVSNKHGQFWDTEANGLQLRDLSFVASSLFSLTEGGTCMSQLAKISITTGSKLVFEKIENKKFTNLCYVDLLEVKVELYEDANKMFYGFLMSRGSSKFSIYTRTKHVFDVWKAYFQYYTVQEDFDRQYSIIDMYEKERGAMYAQCLRVSKKYDKLKTDKICYMAKFIEANTLLEDSESILYEIRLARSISSHIFAEIVNIYEHSDFLVIIYRNKYKQNLREYLVQNRPLNEDTIKAILSQLALALGDAQRSSIIVRQLNPELIFINPADLKIVLCDLACAVNKQDLAKPIFRSCVGFIAPEIVEDKKYSSKAGCFPIGVVTYMLMIGQFPFKEANTQKVLLKSKEQLKVEGKGYSQELFSIVQECLLVDPSKRISLRGLLEKTFVKSRAAQISEDLAEMNRAKSDQSPIERIRSFAQERTYSAVNNDSQGLTSNGSHNQYQNEIACNSLKLEVITQQYDRNSRKPSVAEGFKLGVNVSNFMKRGFYRSTAIGSSRHLGSSFNDQELIFSLSIPGEEGIMTKEFNRVMSLGNKFLQKK